MPAATDVEPDATIQTWTLVIAVLAALLSLLGAVMTARLTAQCD